MGSGPQRLHGSVSTWNDERGFGFVKSEDGTRSTFVHISAFPKDGPRPAVGDRISYLVETTRAGKTKATGVKFIRGSRTAVLSRPPRTGRQRLVVDYVILAAFAAILTVTAVQWPVPAWVWVAYAGVSAITFVAYALDKRAAADGRWRTSESVLLSLGLLGGWPGALLAQQWLRHKTRKASFRAAFWGTVAMNVLAFVLIGTPFASWIAETVTGF
jgi:uncharacterized membrane protein YsdA (DUF1294 family)/cold shock CspA family protein